MMDKNSLGFSLVELMVVVAIVSLLAAVATPVYKDYVLKSKVAKNMQFLTKLSIDVQEIYGRTGKFPNTLNIYGTVVGGNWTMVNNNDIYSAYYNISADGLSFLIGLNLKNLEGIPNYVTPNTASPVNHYSAIIYGMRDFNGVLRPACGISGPAYANEDVPLSYLPGSCQCSNMNVYTFSYSGTIPSNC